MVNPMNLSIIIVSYNTCDLTLNAIRSVFASKTNYLFEVFVVDNASKDQTVNRIRNEFPSVKLISNTENVGFSRANNQAIRQSQGDYVLLLNSDTVIETDTLDIVLNFMEENKKVGASGCKIVLPDGTLDKASRRGFPTPSASFYYVTGMNRLFPKNPRFNQYQLGHLDPDEVYPVDCLVGAFMVVRKEVIEQVGLLDEDYFMYGDDIDWCYRIKEAGWEIVYYPKTTIIHHKSASSRNKPAKIIYEFHRAMLLFYNKHYRKKYNLIVTLLVYLGICTNLSLAMIVRRFMPTK